MYNKLLSEKKIFKEQFFKLKKQEKKKKKKKNIGISYFARQFETVKNTPATFYKIDLGTQTSNFKRKET